MKANGKKSIARTLTSMGGVSILLMTLIVIGVFYGFASKQHQQDGTRFAMSKAEGIARAVDVFEAAMKVTAENAHSAFRKQFAPTMTLVNADEGTLSSFGSLINGSTTEVDRFAQDYPKSNAQVYVAKGEDFVSITSSEKDASGARIIGKSLPKEGEAYAALRASRPFVGRLSTSTPEMTVLQPVRDDAGKVVGATAIELNIEEQQSRLADMVNSTKIFESGGVYVVAFAPSSSEASLILHTQHSSKPLASLLSGNSGEWIGRLKESETLTQWEVPSLLTSQTDGSFASMATSKATGWKVVAEARKSEAMAALYQQTLILAGFVSAAGGALCVGLVLFLRRIVKPLEILSIHVHAIGQGDLSVALESQRLDEIGQITQAVENMRQGLDTSLRSVQLATDNIRSASSEIASGNDDLSVRTEEAATCLEAAVTHMNELSDAVQASANGANEASRLAAIASDVASKGGKVVAEVVTTMESINASSKEIVDIVGVIDGIAFQTNILALNAAVEAARAGEQGRGFAVVASEVRALAQRSAASAKQIKSLIDASVQQVESGTHLVDLAGNTMREIVTSSQKVT
uniref:methyl-accepting chemotaxis protein n=1 Tax=Chitinimonas sp. TaxID=1934313 RepID=UPI0035AFF659